MDMIDIILAAKLVGYDDNAIRSLIAEKVNKQFGAEYAGYALVIGDDGNVGVGQIMSSGSMSIVTSEGDDGHVTLSVITGT